MAINSRNKGASSERELASLVNGWLGVRLIRNLEQSRSGGCDLVVHPDEAGVMADAFRTLAIECKRYGKATPSLVKKWWQQTRDQAEPNNCHPVLCYREDRAAWKVIVPLHLIGLNHSRSNAIESTAELSAEAFCSVMREIA